MIKIETFAPVFHGFYGTVWDCENDIDNYLEEEDLTWEQINFDNKNYENDISSAVCDALETLLDGFVTKIIFQKVVSPKEYNFRNDSINTEVELSKSDLKAIRSFIYDNKEKYIQYLKERYTSYDGFSSFYSNDFDSWVEYTNDFKRFEGDKGHYLGSVLGFICEVLEIDQEALYSEVHYTGDLNGMFYCSPIENQD